MTRQQPKRRYVTEILALDKEGNTQAPTRRYTFKELKQIIANSKADPRQAKWIWEKGDFAIKLREIAAPQGARRQFVLA